MQISFSILLTFRESVPFRFLFNILESISRRNIHKISVTSVVKVELIIEVSMGIELFGRWSRDAVKIKRERPPSFCFVSWQIKFIGLSRCEIVKFGEESAVLNARE